MNSATSGLTVLFSFIVDFISFRATLFCGCIVYFTYKYLVPPKQINTSGQHVVITGCDTGFGRLLVDSARGAGFKIIAVCLTEEGATQFHSDVISVVADLSTEKGLQDVVDAVHKNIGPNGLFALVNNAGIIKPGYIEWLSPQLYKDTMDVNFFAPVRLTYDLLPSLKKAKGRVVNASSVGGFCASPMVAPYVASKHALEAFSDVLRQEMARWGVQVSIIEPASMRTKMVTKFSEMWLENYFNADKDRTDPYGEEYAHAVANGAKEVLDKVAVDPMRTVEVILKSLLLEDPPTRVITGAFGKYFFKPISFLPTPIFDFILKQRFGTPRDLQ